MVGGGILFLAERVSRPLLRIASAGTWLVAMGAVLTVLVMHEESGPWIRIGISDPICDRYGMFTRFVFFAFHALMLQPRTLKYHFHLLPHNRPPPDVSCVDMGACVCVCVRVRGTA